MFEVTLPKIEEPTIDEIPFLPEPAREKAIAAIAKKGKRFDAPEQVVVIQGMRRSTEDAPTLRASIIPRESAIRILARTPILAAKVLARHTEAFELEAGCTCCANAVYIETGGLVAYERLELAA
ncbi:MAG: hypothetical protein MJA83_02955 [Gammaproteobacteria bacterium]|nr:hypothetical protein [Gammaproteobacteria bacterium]